MTEIPEPLEVSLPYSVKIEQTAKGARVTVHVYGKTLEQASAEAIGLYTATIDDLREKGHTIAPTEGAK